MSCTLENVAESVLEDVPRPSSEVSLDARQTRAPDAVQEQSPAGAFHLPPPSPVETTTSPAAEKPSEREEEIQETTGASVSALVRRDAPRRRQRGSARRCRKTKNAVVFGQEMRQSAPAATNTSPPAAGVAPATMNAAVAPATYTQPATTSTPFYAGPAMVNAAVVAPATYSQAATNTSPPPVGAGPVTMNATPPVVGHPRPATKTPVGIDREVLRAYTEMLRVQRSEVLKKVFNMDYDRDVIFTDVFAVGDLVLNVAVANSVATFQMWGRPYSVSTNKNVDYRPDAEVPDSDRLKSLSLVNARFAERGAEIRPADFIRWVLQNVQSVPVIVSSRCSTLVGFNEKNFLNRCVHLNPVNTESTKCSRCGQEEGILVAHGTWELRCRHHYSDLDMERVKLYLPVLVNVAVRTKEMVFSVFDHPTPFGRNDTRVFELFVPSRDWQELVAVPYHRSTSRGSGLWVLECVHTLYAPGCQHELGDAKEGALSKVLTIRCVLRKMWTFNVKTHRDTVHSRLLTAKILPEPKLKPAVTVRHPADRRKSNPAHRQRKAATGGQVDIHQPTPCEI